MFSPLPFGCGSMEIPHKTIFVKFFKELSFDNAKPLSISGWLATDYCPLGLTICYCIIVRVSGGAKAFVHEVIDIDSDEDIADSAIIEKELSKIKKGKAVVDVSDGHLNGHSKESLAEHIFISPDDLVGAVNGMETNSKEGLHTSFNGDGHIYDFATCDDDDYMDYILEDVVHVDDDYDLLQAHFDSMDIPPGVEAPVPWLPAVSKNDKKSDAETSLQDSGLLHGQTAGFLKETESLGLTAQIETNGAFTSASGSPDQACPASHPSQVDLLTPLFPVQSGQSKKNQASSQRKGSSRNFSFGLESLKSRRLLQSFRNKKSPVSFSNSTNFSSPSQLIGAKHPFGIDHHNLDQSMPYGVNNQTFSGGVSPSSFLQTVSGSSSYPSMLHGVDKMTVSGTSSPSSFPQIVPGSSSYPSMLHGVNKPTVSGSSSYPSMLLGVNEPTVSGSSFHSSFPQTVSGGSLYPSFPQTVSGDPPHPSFPQIVSGGSFYPGFPQQISSQDKASTVDPFKKTWLKDPSKYFVSHTHASPATYSSYAPPFAPSVYTLPAEDGDNHSAQSSTGDRADNMDDVLRRFENFKTFDTVQDHSDHHYSTYDSAVKQPSKSWAKRIQEEWKILEKDLPDTIFVRVYETRMDLLRAVMVGAEGTPYHDGLYFFDVFFPSDYPNSPPHVHYHSGGLRLNPNLYNCGKVCLSLLNTWSGHKNEKWMPGVSTMLQVLVSIQGLILNAEPYFNEPGYEITQGSASGEKMSLKYNEDTFILSLRTMTYLMKRPPKHFEDFIMGHFYKRAQDILMACKGYMEGAQVGCLVKGVQDVDAGDKGSSSQFKQSLAGYIGILASAFMKIGVKGCEKFLNPPPPPKDTKRQPGGVTVIDHVG